MFAHYPTNRCFASLVFAIAFGGSGLACYLSAEQATAPLPEEQVPVEWPEEGEDLYRLRAGVFKWFDASIDYGAKAPGSAPAGAASGATDHLYDDGYSLVDSSGNAGGLTNYWGYDNASQLITPYTFGSSTPGQVDFHLGSVANERDVDVDSDWGYEVELSRKLGQVRDGYWGVSLSVGYFSVDDDYSGNFNYNVITDSYDHYLDPFPEAGYAGGEGNDTWLISDDPSRAESTLVGSGSREFDADVWTIRLGPYIDMPLNDSESLILEGSAGLAAVVVDSDFSYSDSYIIDGAEQSSGAKGDESDILFGGYIGATLTWQLNEQWGVYGGANWIGVEESTTKAGDREVELDLSKGYVLRCGLNYWF